ncbi:DUF429 domain-containing protein [uncultured Pseudodesulfovibrio sp.]|uniref:DUF429 domain-containing protein n=1 Tax=uncultured Pseudodesulfovibrio sp. TaxID=2035858 RepID=UPI0029C95C35|nr:DUF429 domain-containing protein [uncultured Pseudodesulfovibrio sp.]
MMKYVGVDGCRGGWFAVWIEDGHWSCLRYADFRTLWAAHSDARCILVDIPVGLAEDADRAADRQMRPVLGNRKSSVFNAPVRRAVYASSKAEARSINQRLIGKSLSEQSLGIVKKMKEVDSFLLETEGAREIVLESHPELCFAKMAGSPMEYAKKDFLGGLERLRIIRNFVPEVEGMLAGSRALYPRSAVEADDMLDAFILAVTAWKGQGRLTPMPDPPEIDGRGLRMAVWYYDISSEV